jgi:pSer/pThr/pTyr-binding forkhead associated (FHA) protein
MKPGMTLRLNVTDMRNGSCRSHEYDRLPLTIGRDETNRLRLDDATVSRLHATIEWDDRGLVLCDLGSCNGTYMKGMRLASYVIRPIDWAFTFSIGPFVLHGAIDEVKVVSLDAETRVLSHEERSRLHPEDAEITVVRRLA